MKSMLVDDWAVTTKVTSKMKPEILIGSKGFLWYIPDKSLWPSSGCTFITILVFQEHQTKKTTKKGNNLNTHFWNPSLRQGRVTTFGDDSFNAFATSNDFFWCINHKVHFFWWTRCPIVTLQEYMGQSSHESVGFFGDISVNRASHIRKKKLKGENQSSFLSLKERQCDLVGCLDLPESLQMVCTWVISPTYNWCILGV